METIKKDVLNKRIFNTLFIIFFWEINYHAIKRDSTMQFHVI